MDRIDEIVTRAIGYAEVATREAPHLAEVALVGLRRMRDNLSLGAPEHPALARLSAFIAKCEREAKARHLH